DQFSFCVALYEGLYGQRAFAGVSVHAYFDSVLEGRVEPPPPGAEVPALVWEAVRRGLDPDPAARHESMSALLSRLRAALEPANAPAGPLWLRTGGPLLILGAVATAALLILRPPRSEPEPAPPRPVEAPAKAVPDTGQASTTTAAAPELVAPDREAADAGLGATAPADETTTTTEATEATATPPEPRRSGWCSMHEDRYTLIHRGPRRHAHVLDRGGRCFECRVETRRDRVRRFQPADCAHYQVCRPVDREECS
ncbi:MAG: hypothetical protein KC636_14675, partial [Myxococcales bacterium]|nr:hypothetical protein [Myxococcales bacterium]